MKISIVIPTLNEEKYLPKLLQDIKKQSFRDYEIIVADADSKDRTKEAAIKFGARVVKGGMPSVGRNSGARVAKGEFIYFFDADIRLPRDFLKKSYNEIYQRKLKLATCESLPISNLAIDRVAHKLANTYIKINQYSNPHAPGFCILVDKKIFDKIGGFNEKLKLAEDHDFVKRASKFTRFRVLKSVKIRVSIRRLKKEGRFVLIGKYLKVESHIMINRKLKKDIIAYEFGDFDKKRDNKLDKRLRRLEKRINQLDRQYSKFMNRNIRNGKIKENYIKNLEKTRQSFERTRDSFRKFLDKRRKLMKEKKLKKIRKNKSKSKKIAR